MPDTWINNRLAAFTVGSTNDEGTRFNNRVPLSSDPPMMKNIEKCVEQERYLCFGTEDVLYVLKFRATVVYDTGCGLVNTATLAVSPPALIPVHDGVT